MNSILGPGYKGNFGPYIQSARLGIYKQYADNLIDVPIIRGDDH